MSKSTIGAIVCVLAIVGLFIFAANTGQAPQATGPAESGVIANQNIPDPTGYVLDNAEVIDATTEAQLVTKLTAFAKSGHGELAVVTVKSLNGLSVEEFGIRLAEKWKVGKQGKDDGVILIISSGDRKVRIEVGRGSVITDAQAGEILANSIVPKLKKNDWSGAISDGIVAIINVASKQNE